MKRKSKGFTLIELLAVIVILGLLMAIAIPSVTKYITQSRKKTVSTTIGNYMSALTTQVNDMEYVFTATNTIYAVPIECIALERGGTNPFGEWHQSNDAYWAYVLVQYNDEASSYTYGFTFKDSAGYGLYPTASEKLQESGSQVKTGLNLNRPAGDLITNITAKENWNGFTVKDDTKLVVLLATSEGETGNGQTTCTLCQKGSNYDVVEQEKDNGGSSGEEIQPPVVKPNLTPGVTFADGTTMTWDEFKANYSVSDNGLASYELYNVNLKSIIFPESAKDFGPGSLSGNPLESVTFTSNIGTLSEAFYTCEHLTTVNYYGTSAPEYCADDVFSQCDKLTEINAPYISGTFCGKPIKQQ